MDAHPSRQRSARSAQAARRRRRCRTRLQSILSQAGTGIYDYPTSLTQGIVPKPLHSHNDYWRPVPVYSALAAGAVSLEADVWLVNGTLHVGHERSALTSGRTFDALYVQPVLDVVRNQNPASDFLEENSNGAGQQQQQQQQHAQRRLRHGPPRRPSTSGSTSRPTAPPPSRTSCARWRPSAERPAT